MKTLNNFDIIKLCQKFEIPLNGIYRRDSIIKGKPNFLTVINSAIGDETNGHWVGYIYNKKKVYYIDSYGVEPFLEIVNLFKGYKIIYNKIQIQSLDSNICGYVVILYALYYFNNFSDKNKEKAIKNFNSLFTPNYDNNEKIINKIFKGLKSLKYLK
jgi:hypothetical protein